MESRKRTAVRIRPRVRTATAANETTRPRVVVFTSVDGTLLDARTFEAGSSRETVRRLRDAGIPVIPVSVMTLDEIAPIAADLGLGTAMIIEAGSAIVRWSDHSWQVEPCGPSAETLLEVVSDIERRSGASLLIYSVMPETDAAQLSGRSGEMLRASTHRCFSEPFIIERGDAEAVARAAAEIGFSIRRRARGRGDRVLGQTRRPFSPSLPRMR
jgi:mannosyl-3-phosphoglycerate phosphatase